jgi:chemotaxis protein MotB
MVSFTRGMVVRSLAVALSAAAFLGGCGSGLKTENEQLRAQTEQLNADLESVQSKVTEAEARKAEAEARAQAAQQEAASLRSQVAAAQAAPVVVAPAPAGNMGGGMGGGMDDSPRRSRGSSGSEVDRIVVAGDVLFAPGQAVVSREGRRELDTIARKITTQYRGDNVRVEGYTDSDPIRKSRWASNQALSLARAEAVEKYLVSKGVSASRISAVGRGSANPRATKAQSRRVEIVITER